MEIMQANKNRQLGQNLAADKAEREGCCLTLHGSIAEPHILQLFTSVVSCWKNRPKKQKSDKTEPKIR